MHGSERPDFRKQAETNGYLPEQFVWHVHNLTLLHEALHSHATSIRNIDIPFRVN